MEQKNTRLRNVGFITFFFSGICTISSGVVVSLLQEEYGFAYGMTGTLLSLLSIGNLLAGLLAGALVGKMGMKPSVLLLTIGYAVGYGLMGLTGLPILLALAFFIVGIAKGSVLNTCTILVSGNSADRTRGMNTMHACYACGALLCPFLISAAARVSTTLAVLALAALLTTVRHNASAYRTGVWDTGSQTLIYGRMHQMEQGQRAPGGFLGVYTEDWSDDQNRSWFREDTPADAAQFCPYTHQSGLQGWALGGLNRLLRVFLPEGTARESALYWVNSTLFYAVQLLTALAVWQELGVLPAAFWMAAILLAPWLQRGMKDLYWVPWTWQLPLLAVLLLCRCTCARGRAPRWCWPLVSLAVLVRCMCGFEFITTFLILCEIPLCYAAAKAYCVEKAPQRACRWLGRAVGAGAAALTGAAAALALWFGQECLCFGSTAAAWQNMAEAITDRISLTDDAVRAVTIGQVLAQYFVLDTEPVLQLGPAAVTAGQLLLFGLAVGAVSVVIALRRGVAAQLVPLGVVWLLSLAAPASWMVLSKAHAAIHTHLVPMLWHFAFVPVSCMLLPALAALLIRGRKKDLVASH